MFNFSLWARYFWCSLLQQLKAKEEKGVFWCYSVLHMTVYVCVLLQTKNVAAYFITIQFTAHFLQYSLTKQFSVLHTVLGLLQGITLYVAIKSSNTALLTIMMINYVTSPFSRKPTEF